MQIESSKRCQILRGMKFKILSSAFVHLVIIHVYGTPAPLWDRMNMGNQIFMAQQYKHLRRFEVFPVGRNGNQTFKRALNFSGNKIQNSVYSICVHYCHFMCMGKCTVNGQR